MSGDGGPFPRAGPKGEGGQVTDALLRLSPILTVCIPFVSGAARMLAGERILQFIATLASGFAVQSFQAVGMAVMIAGAVFAQGLVSRTDAPAISPWISLQSFAAAFPTLDQSKDMVRNTTSIPGRSWQVFGRCFVAVGLGFGRSGAAAGAGCVWELFDGQGGLGAARLAGAALGFVGSDRGAGRWQAGLAVLLHFSAQMVVFCVLLALLIMPLMAVGASLPIRLWVASGTVFFAMSGHRPQISGPARRRGVFGTSPCRLDVFLARLSGSRRHHDPSAWLGKSLSCLAPVRALAPAPTDGPKQKGM
jgi:hypothetical protein